MNNILLVHSSFPHQGNNYGGAKKMITWLGNNLSKNNFNVTFCSIYDKERPDSFVPAVNSIELGISKSNSFIQRNLIFFIAFYKKIKNIFNQEQYDCVISFGETSYFILLLLKRFYGYKLIVSERLDPNYNNNFFDKLRRYCYKYADFLVCQSEGAKNSFSKQIQKRCIVISNPISIPAVEWIKEKANKTIATSGRLYLTQKRQDVLIEAFAIFHKSHPNYKLHIYGDGQDLFIIKRMITELSLDNHVILWGRVENVIERLINDGLFVMTSDYEGVPNALLEAMSIGMPCISTKCSPGGVEMVIENNKNGLLTECGDVIELADKMNHIANNPDVAFTLGNEARSSMNNYSPQKIIKQWIEIIK